MSLSSAVKEGFWVIITILLWVTIIIKWQKAYGIFKGTIDKKGNVSWEDYTGDIAYGGLTSADY